MQHDMRVFGVVLIPRVVEGITRARDGERRNQPQLEAALGQIIRQGAMVIACGLKPNTHWCLKGAEPISQRHKVSLTVPDSPALLTSAWWLD